MILFWSGWQIIFMYNHLRPSLIEIVLHGISNVCGLGSLIQSFGEVKDALLGLLIDITIVEASRVGNIFHDEFLPDIENLLSDSLLEEKVGVDDFRAGVELERVRATLAGADEVLQDLDDEGCRHQLE